MLCVGRSTCASWSTRWSTRMNARRILWLCMMAAVPLKTSKPSFVALWPMMWCWIMAWESCGCGRTRRADWAASACSSPRLSTVSAFFFHLHLNSFLSFSSMTSVEFYSKWLQKGLFVGCECLSDWMFSWVLFLLYFCISCTASQIPQIIAVSQNVFGSMKVNTCFLHR